MPNDPERRVRADQRTLDLGPPKGCFERRKKAERRLPGIEEAAMSDEEWQLYFGQVGKPAKIHDAKTDQAADVFDRAHDRL